jgi:hypothetical protein
MLAIIADCNFMQVDLLQNILLAHQISGQHFIIQDLSKALQLDLEAILVIDAKPSRVTNVVIKQRPTLPCHTLRYPANRVLGVTRIMDLQVRFEAPRQELKQFLEDFNQEQQLPEEPEIYSFSPELLHRPEQLLELYRSQPGVYVAELPNQVQLSLSEQPSGQYALELNLEDLQALRVLQDRGCKLVACKDRYGAEHSWEPGNIEGVNQ